MIQICQRRFTVSLKPSSLLTQYWHFLVKAKLPGPILDLACGDGHNGIFLAQKGFIVTCCDISRESLMRAQKNASKHRVMIQLCQKDLELAGVNPLPENSYVAILVFRYLHRPLMSCIKKAVKGQGMLFYETYTVEQPKFGKPHNPNYLLNHGELLAWFQDWQVIHYFEGIKQSPKRAIGQIVCQKPKDD